METVRDLGATPEPHPLAVAAVAPFRAALAQTGLSFDAAQTAVIDALSTPAPRGYYVWGDVGRGKSLIADTYFAAIPTDRKRRFHFHGFFRDLQAQIARRRAPLDRSLVRLLGGARAVLFDEFHVHDVADAVYLTAAVRGLIDHGILVLTTSNYAPEDLLPDPLFHDRFQPAIDLIRAELHVAHLRAGQDYRRTQAPDRSSFAAGAWRTRPDADQDGSDVDLHAAGHTVRARAVDGETVVVTFGDLCDRPLGVAQYLALADRFRTIDLVAVPDLATVERAPLARFANLVDVLYDRGVALRVTSAAGPDRLLHAPEPPKDVGRAASRLATLARS